MVSDLADRLRHVYWIGGGSGAGKTTVANKLAAAHDWRVYDSDAAMADHAARLSREDAPLLYAFIAMSPDERAVVVHQRHVGPGARVGQPLGA